VQQVSAQAGLAVLNAATTYQQSQRRTSPISGKNPKRRLMSNSAHCSRQGQRFEERHFRAHSQRKKLVPNSQNSRRGSNLQIERIANVDACRLGARYFFSRKESDHRFTWNCAETHIHPLSWDRIRSKAIRIGNFGCIARGIENPPRYEKTLKVLLYQRGAGVQSRPCPDRARLCKG
jgi:hypothetical protein